MPKTIGTLFRESRLIAKTIDRITVEPDLVDLVPWRTEAKLLDSPGGSCLSSTTLLIKGKHVPTYGINSRCYGFLFNAEKCNIYDVSSTDSNSNRNLKLAKRKERADVDLLVSNTVGAKTLDELANEVTSGHDGQMNEVMLDAWKSSCVGLFVRQLNFKNATPEGLKHYYQSLLEIALIQKYLIQAFGYPDDFKICQYEEMTGKLFNFPQMDAVKIYASMYGITDRTYPKLFELLDDDYQFRPIQTPVQLGDYLEQYSDLNIMPFKNKIINKLVENFEPFDGSILDANSILLEPVDNIIGVSEQMIIEIIEECQKDYKMKIRSNKFFKDSVSTESNQVSHGIYLSLC